MPMDLPSNGVCVGLGVGVVCGGNQNLKKEKKYFSWSENCNRKFFTCLIKICKDTPKVKLYLLSQRKKQKASKTAPIFFYRPVH